MYMLIIYIRNKTTGFESPRPFISDTIRQNSYLHIFTTAQIHVNDIYIIEYVNKEI